MLSAFLFSFLLALGVVFLFLKNEYFSKKLHNKKRLGGGIFVFSCIVAIMLHSELVLTADIQLLLALGIGVYLFGLLDDIYTLSWKWQLAFQISIAMLVFLFGVHISFIENPFTGDLIFLSKALGFFLLIFWFVFVMNATNWMDGSDGVSASVLGVSAVFLAILALMPHVYQPPVAILLFSFSGAMFGFLVYNFPQAKIELGTGGIFFAGFFFAYIATFAGAKIATAILILLLPLLDMIWVIGRRCIKKQSIFARDKNHLHHRLLELGFSPKVIIFFYTGFTCIAGFVAIFTEGTTKALFLVLLSVIVFSFFFFLEKKLQKM